MAEKYKKVIADKKIQAVRLMNKDQITKCNIAIHSASIASAAAGAIPIPVADALPITAAQVTMVMALGKIFDAKVTESVAKGLIGAAASTFVGRNIVKMIPILGWGISAAVAAGVTEAIGWTIAVDFAKDAKSRWEQSTYSTEDTYQSDSDVEDQTDNPSSDKGADGSSGNTVDDLVKRAKEFVSGKKARANHDDEYLTLLSEIEKILDDLPFSHPLRELYDKLSLIID